MQIQMEYNNLTAVIDKIGKDVTSTYKGHLTKNKVIATGKLFDSVDYRIDFVNDKTFNLQFIAADHFINVEEGRKAGSKMPPVSAIKSWMIFRGIKETSNSDSRAWAISRSIAKNGIKARPFLQRTLTKLKKYDKQLSDALAKDIKEYMEKKLKNSIKDGNINSK